MLPLTGLSTALDVRATARIVKRCFGSPKTRFRDSIRTMAITRRSALGVLASSVPGAAFAPQQQTTEQREGVAINMLGGAAPEIASGVSWGVPWPRGAVQKAQTFQLASSGRQM